MLFERWVPLTVLAMYAAVAVGFRVAWQRRRFGGTGLALGAQDLAVSVRSALVAAGLAGLALSRALWPAAVERTLLAGPWRPAAEVLGVALVALSLAALVAAQLQMGASWRIGIDRQARPGLVTAGVYRLSRNPIYASGLVSLAGFALLLPGWPAALLLAWSGWAIRGRVLAEEAYLLESYGEVYRAYAARVGRFLPGLGRGLGALPR